MRPKPAKTLLAPVAIGIGVAVAALITGFALAMNFHNDEYVEIEAALAWGMKLYGIVFGAIGLSGLLWHAAFETSDRRLLPWISLVLAASALAIPNWGAVIGLGAIAVAIVVVGALQRASEPAPDGG